MGDDLSFKTISEDTSPVVKLVHSTVYDALKIAASDIHLETGPAGLGIKYRIDGVLTTVGSVAGLEAGRAGDFAHQGDVRTRHRRAPGAAGRPLQGVGARARGGFPGVHHAQHFRRGRGAAHSRQADPVRPDQGAAPRAISVSTTHSIAMLRRLSSEPYGMLLVTGPTGSGKTTTLYAAITEINHGQDKIITIEDPVEYQLPGVLQIPVNEKKGLTFARGLRSILRHDPDKIMVGEIRDPETAQIAVQSALTGHLVFTTVHANNVFDVIGRFMHMGVDPYSFVSALNGIMAQRLVRVNCPHCTVDVHPDEQLLSDSGIKSRCRRQAWFSAPGRAAGSVAAPASRGVAPSAKSCILNDEIRELIIARQPIRLIREAARAQRHPLPARDCAGDGGARAKPPCRRSIVSLWLPDELRVVLCPGSAGAGRLP